MSATTTHHGLPDGMQPFALLELIESLKSELGLLDQDITYLRWMFRHVKHTDFIAGRICAVWISVAKLAVELRISPRKIHRIEARLQRCGIILKSSLANGRRYGKRSSDGLILRAGGINLAPVINRASELADELRQSRLAAVDLEGQKERARDLIREIRSLGSEEALAAAKSVFPRLRPTEIQSSSRIAEIIEALDAVLSDFSAIDGRTEEAARSDGLDRPSTKKERIIKTCSAAKQADPQPVRISPAVALRLASPAFREIIELYAQGGFGGPPCWRNMELAAQDRAYQIGITSRTWQRQCQILGSERAVLCLLVADHNAGRTDRFQVENAAGAFINMVRSEARQSAVLDRLLGELIDFSMRSQR